MTNHRAAMSGSSSMKTTAVFESLCRMKTLRLTAIKMRSFGSSAMPTRKNLCRVWPSITLAAAVVYAMTPTRSAPWRRRAWAMARCMTADLPLPARPNSPTFLPFKKPSQADCCEMSRSNAIVVATTVRRRARRLLYSGGGKVGRKALREGNEEGQGVGECEGSERGVRRPTARDGWEVKVAPTRAAGGRQSVERHEEAGGWGARGQSTSAMACGEISPGQAAWRAQARYGASALPASLPATYHLDSQTPKARWPARRPFSRHKKRGSASG